MRNVFIALAILGQIFYLARLAAERESLVRTGESIYLRTAPVDPRDIFRGDYVTLRYDVNAIPQDALRGDVEAMRKDRVPVFARLEPVPGSDQLYRLDHVTTSRPDEGRFLAGRTTTAWQFRRPPGGVAVSYGIEKLFVEQGKGLDIEDKRGRRDGLQIPMEIELAVNKNGKAAILGYRWSPMGIEFEVVRADRTPRTVQVAPGNAEPQRSPMVRMALHNAGDHTLWVADPGDHCGFVIVPSQWGERAWRPADTSCVGIEPTPADLHPLAPGESYEVTLDLDLPRRHLSSEGQTRPLLAVGKPGVQQFRLAYRPDPAWADAALPGEGTLWMIEMLSPAFSAQGMVD